MLGWQPKQQQRRGQRARLAAMQADLQRVYRQDSMTIRAVAETLRRDEGEDLFEEIINERWMVELVWRGSDSCLPMLAHHARSNADAVLPALMLSGKGTQYTDIMPSKSSLWLAYKGVQQTSELVPVDASYEKVLLNACASGDPDCVRRVLAIGDHNVEQGLGKRALSALACSLKSETKAWNDSIVALLPFATQLQLLSHGLMTFVSGNCHNEIIQRAAVHASQRETLVSQLEAAVPPGSWTDVPPGAAAVLLRSVRGNVPATKWVLAKWPLAPVTLDGERQSAVYDILKLDHNGIATDSLVLDHVATQTDLQAAIEATHYMHMADPPMFHSRKPSGTKTLAKVLSRYPCLMGVLKNNDGQSLLHFAAENTDKPSLRVMASLASNDMLTEPDDVGDTAFDTLSRRVKGQAEWNGLLDCLRPRSSVQSGRDADDRRRPFQQRM